MKGRKMTRKEKEVYNNISGRKDITVSQLSEQNGCSYVAARKILEGLVECGMLIEEWAAKGNKKKYNIKKE